MTVKDSESVSQSKGCLKIPVKDQRTVQRAHVCGNLCAVYALCWIRNAASCQKKKKKESLLIVLTWFVPLLS